MPPGHGSTLADEQTLWSPVILDRFRQEDAVAMDRLLASGRVWRVHDTIEQQIHDLVKTRAHTNRLPHSELEQQLQQVTRGVPLRDFGKWVYYPWSGRLVHLLPPDAFRELRLDRNRLKITAAEQARLARFTVGIVGLSVGNAVANTLALEGAWGHLKMADLDHLSLSNMNRVRASVHDVGLRKTVLIARQIFELDPYMQLSLFDAGLTRENVDEFLLGKPPLDVVVDECDDLNMKFLLRERARSHGLPVLMETSDRGMLDVERFDLEPRRPLFHGLVGDITSADIAVDLADEDKIEFVLPIIGLDACSTRAAASMLEINESLSTWPQVGGDVALGGASMAAAIRQLALGHPLPSGRRYLDLEKALTQEIPTGQALLSSQPLRVSEQSFAPVSVASVPEFIRFVVDHGARAPSAGNCQPWRFYFDGNRLWVLHDRLRSKNYLDIDHRAAYLALGAAIENIRIAAAHCGYRTYQETFPRESDPSIVAMLTFEAGGAVAPEMAELFAQICRRTTYRGTGPRVPLASEHLAALAAACTAPGYHLHILTDEADMREIGHIVGVADRIRFLCPELHREVMAEIRWTAEAAQRSCDGLDIATLGLRPVQTLALRLLSRPDVALLLREANGGAALEKLARKAITASSAVALLTVDRHGAADIVRAGQAFERLWLLATKAGLAFHPWVTAIYMFPLLKTAGGSIFTPVERNALLEQETRFRKLFALTSEQLPLVLWRISYTPALLQQSLRLPTEQILFYGAPPGTEGQCIHHGDRLEGASPVAGS